MSNAFDRRTFIRSAAAAGGAGALALLAASCAAGSGAKSDPNTVSLWGVTGTFVPYQTKMIRDFNKLHPDIKVDVNQVPSQGTGDATSVITAVRGGTAPDLWLLDRFSAAQYAAIGLIEPIDGLIDEFEDKSKEEFLADWLGFTVGELTYQGNTYGLPFDTDARGLFVNRKMLRDAGIDQDEFDWKQNGPVTMARMAELNDQLSKKDGADYTHMGFIPWYGEGWPFTWGLGFGATYFDQQQCGMTMNDPKVRKIFEFYDDWAKQLNYKATDTFQATYEPTGHPPAQTSFQNNRLAFMVSVPSTIQTFDNYVKDLEWGVTYLPTMEQGDDPYTWSGGFALCLPKGSKKNRAVWEFMKYYTSKRGQEIYMPPATTVPSNIAALKDPKGSAKSIEYFVEAMPTSTCRPPLPVGGAWWDSLADARSSVLLGTASPQEAVERAQARVDPMMQTYCPFTLPKDYDKVRV
ncbi:MULTISPECIES: ABC transporter substrate-binding protein [unclassified Curtobacterium]|uniref:ABC transporter substrate-binding protein n=1 Tax=unclassified Curtobacterium TaxID=257496 RepID=UPI000F4BEC7E|nr:MULTISPECIES: ABC transporter substrate-binding protein [unclassified Curtobacterium]ROP65891.1 carbohydrate ABC transporter substrate-binding protein (CUT1 family) [Curtobacterium sp. ZW137]TCK62874.1 carbohydrate ABC transporter substrate-binding protein (CUT1 family) [Curtobacterium sp. PhB136]